MNADLALERGRQDKEFFWHYFLNRKPHPGQLRFITEGEATINALACANRYGKTTLLAGEHFHANIYKTGAESRYLDDAGAFDLSAYVKTRYRTVHAAGEWEQTTEVWEDALKLISENPRLAAFISAAPLSKPPHISFINGSKWLLRTLGVNSSGVDGKSFYLLSIDEAGWIAGLEEMMNNVLRVRVADVRGRIIIVGTFKPGVSKDFYKVCVRASAYTGAALGFDHRAHAADADATDFTLDAAIRRYCLEVGFDLDLEIQKARQEGAIQ